MIKLGVNIDHVATLRQARMNIEPEPVTGLPELQKKQVLMVLQYI